jgi:cytochrome c oxidase subunit III
MWRPGSFAVAPNALVGMWFALAAITMLFMGLTSAYIVRRGLDPQWSPVRVPDAALGACAFLLASSISLEYGRRQLRRGRSATGWLLTTWTFALVFVAGQIAACRQLAAAGLYLSTNPHSSFIYLFTTLHGLHVLAGMAALGWLIRTHAGVGIIPNVRIRVIAIYWHAMAVLWIYLLAVLFAWN